MFFGKLLIEMSKLALKKTFPGISDKREHFPGLKRLFATLISSE